VVQRYDPVQRIVDIRFSDMTEIETVSVLEVEHGSENHEEYGATLGEYVFICDDSGSPMPHVPAIGLAPASKTDPVALLSTAVQQQSSLIPSTCEWSGAIMEPNDIDWVGEVVSLEMDGRVGVRLANGKTVLLELRNVLLLKLMEEGDMDMYSEGYGSESNYDQPMPLDFTFEGSRHSLAEIVLANARLQRAHNAVDDGASDASWVTEYSEEDVSRARSPFPSMPFHQAISSFENTNDPISNGSTAEAVSYSMNVDDTSEDADWVDESIEMAPSSPPMRLSRSPSPPPTTILETSSQAGPSSAPRDPAWEPFMVLETAPSDHRYFGEAPASSSRARMKKINAEHKALRTSLPGEC
jgi:ubiquitin-conjugating enzyme E2 O